MGEPVSFFLWRLDQRVRAFADHAPEVTPSGLVRRNIRVTTAGAFSDDPLRLEDAGTRVKFMARHPRSGQRRDP